MALRLFLKHQEPNSTSGTSECVCFRSNGENPPFDAAGEDYVSAYNKNHADWAAPRLFEKDISRIS
jgi:hypothetical protein